MLSMITNTLSKMTTSNSKEGESEDNRTGWWRDAIVYQIWPKSFYSGKGSPTGDIPGIIEKLDYIKSLGVNTIWLSPHYASPMVDEGYDISNYEDVNPMFGTLQDAENLIKECHDRELRIIFDLVINHSSDQHAWFKESRSSKTNPKRDWYIWRPARYDDKGNRQPPTNWASAFSQSAWQWDEHTQEYYLHLFAIEQPDLNWENEECRKAIYDSSMRFWLDKGLDGFRVDTCALYSKPKEFKDVPIVDPKSPFQKPFGVIDNGPRIHEFIQEMGKILASYDAMTVGELARLQTGDALKFISYKRNEFSMCFQFDAVLCGMDVWESFGVVDWTIGQLAKATEKIQTVIDGTDAWTTSLLENHDVGRSVSRFGIDKDEQLRIKSAKMLCLYILAQSGTPYIYQGEEIGMTNVPLDWDEKEYLDVATINFLKKVRDQGLFTEEEIKEKIVPKVNLLARDNSRTPVQWTSGPNAGFTKEGVQPWMRVNDNYKQINVESQLEDKESILSFYKQAIQLRKQYPDLFTYGKFSLLVDYQDEKDSKQKVLAFAKDVRKEEDGQEKVHQFKRAVVLLNFSETEQEVQVKGLEGAKVAISSHNVQEPISVLQPFEGRILFL